MEFLILFGKVLFWVLYVAAISWLSFKSGETRNKRLSVFCMMSALVLIALGITATIWQFEGIIRR